MAQNVSFRLTLDRTPEVLSDLHNGVLKALEEIGLQGVNNAIDEVTKAVYNQPPAPTYRRTGLLRNSLAYAVSGDTPKTSTGATSYHGTEGEGSGHYSGKVPRATSDKSLAVYIGTNVEYAPYVELGSSTAKRGPRPFIKPAIANYIDQYKQIIQKNLGG